jgi:hypothetical protein
MADLGLDGSRVKRFHLREETRNLDNVLRGFSNLIVSVE